MRVDGLCFAFDAPDTWEIQRESGGVIAVAPEEISGFRTNIVLRESRIAAPFPEALASLAQAQRAALTQAVPGAHVFSVEAPVVRGVERRRFYVASPGRTRAEPDRTLCVLSVQDLFVSGDLVAEATVTMPFVQWMHDPSALKWLESLDLKSPESQVLPQVVSECTSPDLDAWATARDGLPREKLNQGPRPEWGLSEPLLTLSATALAAFVHVVTAKFTRKVTNPEARWELAACGLVDEKGRLSDWGDRVAKLLRHAYAWQLDTAESDGWTYRIFSREGTSMFIATRNQQPETHLLGQVDTEDLVYRLIAIWGGLSPCWPMEFKISMHPRELQDKLDGRQVWQDGPGEASEYLREEWTLGSVSDGSGEPYLTWANTERFGPASIIHSPEESAVHIESALATPVWLSLMIAADELSGR